MTDTDLGEVPVRTYLPSDPDPREVCVYAHGGGWALGSLETHHAMCSRLAAQSGCAVVDILRDQLDASQEEFWRCVRDGEVPNRGAADNRSLRTRSRRTWCDSWSSGSD